MMNNKIFDEYNVACEDCQHYWNDTCDSVPEGLERSCTSFLATRRVDIPLQIKVLRKRLKWLTMAICTLGAIEIVHIIVSLISKR